jgi:hypothetical protein
LICWISMRFVPIYKDTKKLTFCHIESLISMGISSQEIKMGFKRLNVNKLLGFIAVFWLDLKSQHGAR